MIAPLLLCVFGAVTAILGAVDEEPPLAWIGLGLTVVGASSVWLAAPL